MRILIVNKLNLPVVKSRKTQIILAVVLGLFLILFPLGASAGVGEIVGGWLSWGVEETFLNISEFFIDLVGKAISLMADIFERFVKYQTNNAVYGVFVVDQSWQIIRNFVNIFFILVLIIMAFGTIFDVQNYSYQKMLAPFLIAAIFVNFSLVIGQYIITVANGLSSIFLSQVAGITNDFAQGTSLVRLATNSSLMSNVIGGVVSTAIASIFSVILLVLAFLAFASMAIFAIVRLFFLWFLLIISPIAWLGYSLPNLRERTWGSWWNNFLCWCFFLPYYLFFMMFAVIFIRQQNAFPQIAGGQVSMLGLAANDLMFYILSLIFMVGGLAIAKKSACATGTYIGKAFGTIEGGVRSGVINYFPGSRQVRSVAEGVKQGTKAYVERKREEGIPGLIAGEREARLRQAKWAQRFGDRGAVEKQRGEEINKLKGGYERETDINKLRGLMAKGTEAQQLAAREVLKERGDLKADELLGTYKLYGGRQSLAALKFARSIDYGELSGGERDLLLTGIEDPEIKRKILKAKAEKGDFRSKPGQTPEQLNAFVEQLKNYTGIFQTQGDQREFLTKIKKYALEAAVRTQYDLGLIKKATGEAFESYQEAIREEVRKMKLDDIIELSSDTLAGLVAPTAATREIIKTKLTKETIAAIPGKAGTSQLEVLITSNLLSDKKVEIEAEETGRLEKQAEAQAKGMKPLVDSINELINTIKTKT